MLGPSAGPLSASPLDDLNRSGTLLLIRAQALNEAQLRMLWSADTAAPFGAPGGRIGFIKPNCFCKVSRELVGSFIGLVPFRIGHDSR